MSKTHRKTPRQTASSAPRCTICGQRSRRDPCELCQAQLDDVATVDFMADQYRDELRLDGFATAGERERVRIVEDRK